MLCVQGEQFGSPVNCGTVLQKPLGKLYGRPKDCAALASKRLLVHGEKVVQSDCRPEDRMVPPAIRREVSWL
jgi:hypothetical protein